MKRNLLILLFFCLILSVSGAPEWIALETRIIPLGGNVRGFGVLAEYPEGGPREIRLVRDSKEFASRPGYRVGWPNIALLRVFDPDGRLTAYVDLGLQRKQVQEYVLKVPAGRAGVWRISVSNGSDDQYRLSFPRTEVWGVRGEMALGIGKRFPKKMYLYVPETAEKLIVEVFPFYRKIRLPVLFGEKDLADYSKQPNKRRFFTVIGELPAGKVLALDTSVLANGGGVAIDGMPGLLCPTPEAADKLKGGLLEVEGSLLCGPLQARARRRVLQFQAKDFAVDLKYPARAPENLGNWQTECLLFGKYGSLGMLIRGCGDQLTDPSKLQAGCRIPPEKRGDLSNRRNFLRNRLGAYFDAAGLAGAITIPARMNFAYHNRGLIHRAILAAFSNFVLMQGDDLLREGDFRTTNYPITHAFFAYDALAKSLYYLQDLLDPESREIWREAVTAIGDKCASYMAYESNQWADMISGHLYVHLATGEVRFRRYFELQMAAYLDNLFTPASKHGQHPAGYFLEEGGPDGNYDHLNLFSVVSIWHHYSALKDADPVLSEKLKRGIQKNLEFKKFFWVPEEGSPTALNNRTWGRLSSPSWPGDYMARNDFDLAWTHSQMKKMPEKGVGSAGTFAHHVNSEEWARRLINWDLAQKGKRWSGLGTHWSRELYDAYSRPLKAKKVKLPYEALKNVWTLPGFAAWKNAGLYGIVFADVTGAKWRLPGITSGGPLGIWSAEAGWFLCGLRSPKKNAVSEISDVTWSCIGGYRKDGSLFVSGRERNTLRASDGGIEISGHLPEGCGTLLWTYRLAEQETILTVSLTETSLKTPFLLLPFRSETGTRLTFVPGGVLCERNGGKTEVGFSSALRSEMIPARGSGYSTLLKIAFPPDGILRLAFRKR